MGQRIRAILPTAVAVAILTFAWLEVSLNFSFHWFTDGDLGIGLSLPGNFHLVTAAAFVSWAMFFAAGADRAAALKVVSSSVIGAVCGLLLMWISPAIADLPEFWGIAVVGAVGAFAVVLAGALGDWYYTPAVFGGLASVFFWWVATGLDGWVEGGGGKGNSVAALADRATAGSGAFGGALSTPIAWVFVNTAASLACGVVLGLLTLAFARAFTPALGTRSPQVATSIG
jgi:hypothetical protein